MSVRLKVAEQMIAHYNAQDAAAYVSLMVEDACEANYRGPVLGRGRSGVRTELEGIFAKYPRNRAEIISGHSLGEHVVLHERVFRSDAAEPFDVMSIYSFDGDQVSRVEFVR